MYRFNVGKLSKVIFKITNLTVDETDSLYRAIKKYSKHHIILRVNQYLKNLTEFSFVNVDEDIIAKEIKNLDIKKAVSQDDTQPRY